MRNLKSAQEIRKEIGDIISQSDYYVAVNQLIDELECQVYTTAIQNELSKKIHDNCREDR